MIPGECWPAGALASGDSAAGAAGSRGGGAGVWTDARDSRRRFSLQACAGGIGVLCPGEVTRAEVLNEDFA